MRLVGFTLLFTLLFVGCGPEGEMKDQLAEMEKADKESPATTLSEAWASAKEAHEFVSQIENTQKEEGEKYPQLLKDAKKLEKSRADKLVELSPVGGIKQKAQKFIDDLKTGKPMSFDFDVEKAFKSVAGANEDPQSPYNKFACSDQQAATGTCP